MVAPVLRNGKTARANGICPEHIRERVRLAVIALGPRIGKRAGYFCHARQNEQ